MNKYEVPIRVEETLRKSRILAPDETPQKMFDRVVDTLFSIELKWGTNLSETSEYKDFFGLLMAEKAILPGTPTLTNAGRFEYRNAALSSCVVIPVDLRDKNVATAKIKNYYRQNMGSGYDFTPYEDPVGLLLWLNELSVQETASGNYDRYIGNMGSLNILHPKVRDFIHAKRDKEIKHFNISIDVSEKFMDAAVNGKSITTVNGEVIDARELLREIAESAHFNGDPGLIYLERMNKDNPVASISAYTSTPPCAEMGLAPGETCQFGYINLAKFSVDGGIDWGKLAKATTVMTRALDNGIEVSLNGYPDQESNRIANLKRKIGIGVCGLADVFIKNGIPYDSEDARFLAKDILSFINFTSKVASIKLAEKRGSCIAMSNRFNNSYYSGFIENRYAKRATRMVSSKDWQDIALYIKNTGYLRNILTTALPPTGRASILMGVTSSIEPIFSTSGWNDGTRLAISDFIKKHLNFNGDTQLILEQAKKDGSFQKINLSKREVLKTAKEINPAEQMRMIAVLTGVDGIYDEAASKTINLANNVSVDDVFNIFLDSYLLGLKNISVYRDGSYINQPEKL